MNYIALVLMLHSAFSLAQNLPAGTRSGTDISRDQTLRVRIQSAEAALEKGDFASAIPLLNALSLERPTDAQIAYDLGFAEERAGKDADASAAYTKAAELAPDLADPKLALGLMDARAGRNDKARAELQAAGALVSASPELRGRAFRALATLDEQARPDAAQDELLQAVKLTGETAEDVALSGRLAGRAGDAADAEEAYRHALAVDPGNIEATASLAQLLVHSAKSGEAENFLLAALKAHPNDPQLVTELASLYGQTGKPAQGAALLTQARAGNSQLAENRAATRMLARLDALAGNDEQAAKLYGAVAQTGKADPMLLDEYGGVLVKLARYPEAQAVFTQALTRKEAFPSPQDWAETESHLAFAASKNHNPQLTLQSLALRATVLPNSPPSLFLQAISYDALRQNSEAVKAYEDFLRVAGGKYPDQEFQARHRLVALEHMK